MLVKRFDPRAILPTRGHSTDAGLDLYAIETRQLRKGGLIEVRTGIGIELDIGTVGLIWDKSSMGRKGVKVLGGVIDEGYRGEIIVVLCNFGMNLLIEQGMKIAQLLVQRVEYVDVQWSEELSDSERGDKGFGSTGER